LQLRFFQTLLDLSNNEGNHTYIPIPLELFESFKNKGNNP
jgi:hypothetical protein